VAVIEHDEIWSGRKATLKEGVEREYTRVWRAITDTFTDLPFDVAAAVGVTAYDAYPTDSEAFVKSIEAANTEEPTVWLVTVQYSSKTGSNDNQKDKDQPDQKNQDPLARPAIIEWGSEMMMKAIQDEFPHGSAFSKRIKNSAGDLFDPPIEIEDARVTVKITKNLPAFDTAYLSMVNHTNSGPWMGGDTHTWKLQSVSSRKEYDNGTFFWPTTWTAAYREETWQLKVLDQGYREIIGTAPNQKAQVIWDTVNDTPNPYPVLLDGNGKRLRVNGTPVFLPFDVYGEADFGSIPTS
jgi:hypothetical protein